MKTSFCECSTCLGKVVSMKTSLDSQQIAMPVKLNYSSNVLQLSLKHISFDNIIKISLQTKLVEADLDLQSNASPILKEFLSEFDSIDYGIAATQASLDFQQLVVPYQSNLLKVKIFPKDSSNHSNASIIASLDFQLIAKPDNLNY